MTGTPLCVFDSILAGDSPAYVVLDEPEIVGFLDIRPVFAGHTLVVPRRHWASITELPDEVLGRLMSSGRRIAGAQKEALGAEGTFFGLNDIISQSVPHVHLHVIPRRKGDGLRGFFWPRVRYEPGQAEITAAAIRRALEGPSERASR